MKFQVDHDFHIHSHLSICADGDMRQNKDAILAYGVKNGFKHICMTDHFWDRPIDNNHWGFYDIQDLPHIEQSLPLPQAEGTAFHFGCETDVAAGNVVGITPETMEKMEIIIIPTTHMHFDKSGVLSTATVEERALAWCERLDAVLDKDLPFHKVGIAHLTTGLIDAKREANRVLSLISNERLKELFTKAQMRGVGIELNMFSVDFDKRAKADVEQTVRVFGIAKDCGCKFYLGSDAHHPEEAEQAPVIFEKAVDFFGLTEEDKFRPFG